MRSISEIYAYLAQQKATMSELDAWVTSEQGTLDSPELLLSDINSGSKVAIWRLWLWIMAAGSWIVESLFGVHQGEIDAALESKAPHTLRWYADETKRFQYGYPMIWSGNFFYYDPVIPEAQIVTYATAREQGGKVIIKTAKNSGANKEALSTLEKAALVEFWNKWKDAGVKLEVVSLPPDAVKVTMTIVRDRLVLDAINRLLRDPSVYPILDAINHFSDNLEFDGVLKLSALVDAIQAAEGVVDIQLNAAWHKPAGGTYALIDMSIDLVAGYFVFDEISSNIQYIDNVNVEFITQ